MVTSVRDLMAMPQSSLDDLFRERPPGPIPEGDTMGTAIVAPGTRLQGPAARFVRWLAWRGKVFDPRDGMLKNKITIFNLHLIKARVYKAASWFDGREAIILDYSKTSLVARKIRDEIREVAPGLYLGQVYWGQRRILNFVLRVAAVAGNA